MFSRLRLGTKLLWFIAPIMVVAMGIVFTWLIKKEERLIRGEIKTKAEMLALQLEIIREYIAEKQEVQYKNTNFSVLRKQILKWVVRLTKRGIVIVLSHILKKS